MKCPRCGTSMRRGTLRGREDNDFLPEEESVPKLLTNHLLNKRHGVFSAARELRPALL